MATENNNQQINQFTGGMNTDLSYNMLEQTNYTLAKNLRIAALSSLIVSLVVLIANATVLFSISSCMDYASFHGFVRVTVIRE